MNFTVKRKLSAPNEDHMQGRLSSVALHLAATSFVILVVALSWLPTAASVAAPHPSVEAVHPIAALPPSEYSTGNQVLKPCRNLHYEISPYADSMALLRDLSPSAIFCASATSSRARRQRSVAARRAALRASYRHI